jgi:ATP-dependent Clp protease ATP-binding subunit ClpC
MIEDPLGEDILRGTFKGKDTITVRVDGSGETRQIKFDATVKEKALAGAGATDPPAEAKK